MSRTAFRGESSAVSVHWFVVALAAACRLRLEASCGHAQPAVPPPSPAGFSPQQLAEAWDRERVSWPVPPLVRHADVEARLKEVQPATPDLFQLEEIGASVEGRSINHLWFGRGPVPRAALVADARRRADGHRGAVRHLRAVPPPPRRAGVRAHPRCAHHPRRADAQSGRRRALPAPQRPGHRHQPRRAAAADARGPRPQGAARPAEPAGRLQPAQPGLAHVGRQDRAAGHDLAAVGGVRRGAHREPGPHPDEADCARSSATPSNRSRPAASRATTTSSRCGRSATTSRSGARTWC